ncbi:DsRNA-binding protein 3 [Balamuthia mandrillaris]
MRLAHRPRFWGGESKPSLMQQRPRSRFRLGGCGLPIFITSCTPAVRSFATNAFAGAGREVIGLCKKGRFRAASTLFHKRPDAAGASALIRACTKPSDLENAFSAYYRLQAAGHAPDVVMLSGLAHACRRAKKPERALPLWDDLSRHGLRPDLSCFGALSLMCSESEPSAGSVTARKMVQALQKRILSTTVDELSCAQLAKALINGEKLKAAFELFDVMQEQGVVVRHGRVYSTLLMGCAKYAALSLGRRVHERIREDRQSNFSQDVVLQTALLDMYGKCGSLEDARQIFRSLSESKGNPAHLPVQTWTGMIHAEGIHGNGVAAMGLFREMQEAGVKPNHITFVSLLNACSHASMAGDASQLLSEMEPVFGVKPTVEHFNCVVDALARSGKLAEAEGFIEGMPVPPDTVTWKALLGASRWFGDVERAERAAKRALEATPEQPSVYVALANTHTVAGRRDEARRLRRMMKDKGLQKEVGRTWIEIDGEVTSFQAHDRTHPMTDAIYNKLEEMNSRLKASGYTPDTRFVIHEDESHQEQLLCSHSEKLAIAFGLLRTPEGSPLLLVKNLRVCPDCHAATVLLSRLYSRRIVVRDANRFHHFSDGRCSCNNFW